MALAPPRADALSDALHATAVALLDRHTVDDVLRGMAERVRDLVGASEAYVYLVDPARRELVVRTAVGHTSKYIGLRLSPGEGVAGRVYETGTIVVVEDYATWPGRSTKIQQSDVRAVVGLPLRGRDGLAGVLGVYYHEADHGFSPAQVQTLERFAELASLALDHARILEDHRASEARFRATFERSPVGRGIVAPDGRWLSVNAALCQILGRTEAEMRGLRNVDVTHPDDLPATRAAVDRLLRGEAETFDIEKRYVRGDGSLVWVRVVVSVVRDASGAPAYLIGDIIDISGQRRETVTRGLVRRMLQDLASEGALQQQAMRALGRSLARGVHDERLADGLAAYASMGLGTLTLAREGEDRFEFDGDDLLERRAGATQPTCHLALGYLEGLVGGDRRALGAELRCQSLGHERCRIVVRRP